MNNKLLVVLVSLAIAGAIATGFWWFFWAQQKVVPESRAQIPAEEAALGGALYQNVEQQQNPFKQAPDVAPLPAGTNPFKDAYRNPFDK
ncbi:MAG: hypothetical protein HYW98_00215 [Candidatus Wildermuthbacteria bacterium]|nr:hypothetical protein [Candidatus Wildermuthbacteria bacterium]